MLIKEKITQFKDDESEYIAKIETVYNYDDCSQCDVYGVVIISPDNFHSGTVVDINDLSDDIIDVLL